MSEKTDEEGNKKEGDIDISFTGLRPGEKLYEELLIGDNVRGTDHQKIMTACEDKLDWKAMKQLLDELDTCCHNFDVNCIRRILLDAPTGYTPRENES